MKIYKQREVKISLNLLFLKKRENMKKVNIIRINNIKNNKKDQIK